MTIAVLMKDSISARALPSQVGRAAARIRRLCPTQPSLALVLGSGFRDVFCESPVVAAVPFTRLPGFPRTTVSGHAGQLLVVNVSGTNVVVLQGRSHFYEGHDLSAETLPIRVLAEAGIRHLILTNAAGGIRAGLRPGDFMAIKDHINLMGTNPLRGPVASGRERFVDLSEVYDRGLRKLLHRAAARNRLKLSEGVYLAVPGPSYETPSEIRAFARLGADAVGMSTVPEAIVARQCGVTVAALSCITNLAAGRARQILSHEEVLSAGRNAQARATSLIQNFVQLYAESRC